jgi:hypothetical protein
MEGLSKEIEYALNTIIQGLNYNFFSTDGTNGVVDDKDIESYVQDLDAEKMKTIMESKVSSFNSAKKILNTWMGSPNAPSRDVIRGYIQKVVNAGESATNVLRKALAGEINFEQLEAHKHNSAIKAKAFILEAIFDLDSSLIELKKKLESDDLTLTDREFKIGYPERFSKGEFFPKNNYWKNWSKEKDVVNICPFSTEGKIITLQDLKIQLPKVPKNKSEILYSDLPKKEQYWRRQEAPSGITPDNVEMWDAYIVEEFRRRREGIWFMNNGKPVYLTGNAYFALQWCKMLDDGGYMNFRFAQLYMFYHLEACIIDKNSLGQLFLKSRRTGFTYIILSILLNMSTTTANAKYGMTSKSGDDVQEAFSKFSYMFLSLPFFFRPVVRGKEDSPNELFFGKPSNNSKEAKKGRKTGIEDYLNTQIDHRPTKNDSYDSIKLDAYLGDESYKWVKPNDYIIHLGMISPTMMPNGKVVGKAFIGSTMGARAKGGEAGVELINGSKVIDRDSTTGKTSTGLYFYFLPAQENMEAFTDKYGKCWVETPPKGTLNVSGEEITIGSLEYLLAVEEQKRKQSDKALNEQLRTYPRTVEHALRDESTECVYNLTKLYEQLDNNDTVPEESLHTVGNFKWVSGVKDSDVEFYPDKNGRFKVSWLPSTVDDTEHLKNRVKEVNGKFYPMNLECVRFGCDPFSLKSTHGKGSKGGIHGKTIMFPEGGAPSNKFVLEYLARPADETIFFEDVIMCCRFYGAPILVESNRIDLLRHMRNRGYRGFAMDRLDRHKSKLNENEKEYGGQVMSGKDILDSHMNAIGLWIENYVGVYTDEQKKVRPIGEMGDMPFSETLRDWVAFNPDKRTEYDATISSGLAIMACQTDKYKGKKKEVRKISVKSIVKQYSNAGSISTKVNI